MKLGGVADSLIGDPQSENGLSRNERKRLNFATETLTKPSLLYVDEPTTGLDSVMAASVVKQLKVLKKNENRGPLFIFKCAYILRKKYHPYFSIYFQLLSFMKMMCLNFMISYRYGFEIRY